MSVGVGGGGGARGSRWSGLPSGAEVSGAEDPGAAGESFSVCGADEGWVLEIARKAPREHLFGSTKCEP